MTSRIAVDSETDVFPGPMACFRVSTHQLGSPAIRVIRYLLTAVVLFAPAMARPRVRPQWDKDSQDSSSSATVQGSVRDSGGRLLADVTVYLQINIGTEPLITRTDRAGTYHFLGLREGVYSLRAEKEEYGRATFGPWVLQQKQAKKIDLTLAPYRPSTADSPTSPARGKQAGQNARPEFFDEPAFTVAGVTDSTNLGGHGSNTVARSKESLAKETVALSRELPASVRTASTLSDTAQENELRAEAERAPADFTANHRLGEVLVAEGKAGEALPYLERASRLNPGDFEAHYDLARAYADLKQYDEARTTAAALLAVPDKPAQNQARVHHLLADVEEKQGDSLTAVGQYQRAAELDPNERPSRPSKSLARVIAGSRVLLECWSGSASPPTPAAPTTRQGSASARRQT
jgi:tetratricopeptide (TPR) repeat protein